MRSQVQRAAALALSLASLLLAFSCATSSGSSYSSSLDSDKGAAERSAAAKAKAEASRPSPPPSSSDDDSGSGIVLFLAPREPTGTLVLEGLPADAEVYVDGGFRFGRVFELALGSHDIQVRSFGRMDWNGSIFMTQNARLKLEPELLPASFSLLQAKAEPYSFDPGNPGLTGSTLLSVAATAPGSLRVSIYDEAGRLVRELGESPILSFRFALPWDGRDEGGKPLPSGSYRVELEGLGEDGLRDTASLELSLAPDLPERYWLALSGISGPLLAPDARSLPPGSFQAGTALIAHIASPEEGLASTIPLSAGLRFGISKRSELAFTALGLFRTTSLEELATSWASGTVSWKRRLSQSGPVEGLGSGSSFASALAIKAGFRSFLDENIAYYPPSWDGPTNFGGISAALPLEWAGFGTRVFLAPELLLSTFYPGWEDDRWEVPALFSWLYLRAGAEARLGPDLVLAVSGALRTEPLGLTPDLLNAAFPVSTAAELHWYGDDGLVLSAYALAELGGIRSYAVYGGFGIGFAR